MTKTVRNGKMTQRKRCDTAQAALAELDEDEAVKVVSYLRLKFGTAGAKSILARAAKKIDQEASHD